MIKTWVVELAVAALVLSVTAALTNASAPGWLSVGAVLGSFAHMQVADRLQEAEGDRPQSEKSVHCQHWLQRYLIAKETLWVLSFALSGMWPALVGCALFLFYPVWRKFYRKWRAK